MSSKEAIGIFDSGIGGLTVAQSIAQLLPHEKIIYFGDTAHFPYGDKERSSIQQYCLSIAEFLHKKNCKAIVIACNTASSACFKLLNKHFSDDFPIVDVIRPAVSYLVDHPEPGKVGIIATKGTTNSRVYPKLIKEGKEKIDVASCATPLLAPMIEEGFFNNNISKSIIASYLEKRNIQDINTLLLACTHYPIIETEINNYYKSISKNVNVLNSADLVASFVKKTLQQKGLLSEKKQGDHEFYVSDYTSSFEQSSSLFFGEKVKLEKLALWK